MCNFFGGRQTVKGGDTPLADIGLTPSITWIKARMTNIEHLILKRNLMHE